MSSPSLHPETSRQIATVAKQPPQALLLTGPYGVDIIAAAEYISESIDATVEKIVPKKRNGTQFVEDWEGGSLIIEDIRTLYTTTRSKSTAPRVFVLDFGNRNMTHGAQNAFLKLLEEPQPHVYFILATHHPEFLLPTIRSRCQRINIRPTTKTQSLELLDQLAVTDTTMRARILYIAEGLPVEITRLANDTPYYQQRVASVQDAKAVLEGSCYQKLLIIRKYKDQRPLALLLIDDMLLQLRRTLGQSQDTRILSQINTLISSYDKIQQNGNIQLQLARVLL